MGDMHISHLVTKVAIFIGFELRTPSTPSIGLHPIMLAPCYWLKFFGIKNKYSIIKSFTVERTW